MCRGSDAVDTVSLTELQYRQLPSETVVRHEVGHAVMAHRCGGFVKRIVFGRKASGENYGRAFWAVPDRDQYVLVLTGGVLALFLHDRPAETAYRAFIEWASTPRGYLMAVSGAGDWSEILRCTGQPSGYGMEDFLERALRPYFDEAARRLAAAGEQLDELTALVLAQPPGIGPWSLKRFFAGDRPSRMAEWMDRPNVVWAARREVRGISET